MIVAVDLDAYATPDIPFLEKDGTFRYEGSEGFFEYRHIGSTPSGTHVLWTAGNAGGPETFQDLILVRVEGDSVFENGRFRHRFILRRIGAITLGDRDDGRMPLLGNKLVLGVSRYRSLECELILE